jgi:hypothetical protein
MIYLSKFWYVSCIFMKRMDKKLSSNSFFVMWWTPACLSSQRTQNNIPEEPRCFFFLSPEWPDLQSASRTLNCSVSLICYQHELLNWLQIPLPSKPFVQKHPPNLEGNLRTYSTADIIDESLRWTRKRLCVAASWRSLFWDATRVLCFRELAFGWRGRDPSIWLAVPAWRCEPAWTSRSLSYRGR